jgi:hypothetical protein
MTNIVPYDDTPIVDEKELAEKHNDLVEKLKQSLYVGQVGFIKAGQFLHEIKESKSYKAEDATQDITWTDFVKRPDLPINGTTDEGRLRTAQKLVQVWTNIASHPNVDEQLLAKIGYTKLAMVAGAMNKNPDTDLSDWLHKAETLTLPDLQVEVSSGGKTIAESNACKCENIEEVDAFRCKDCKKFYKKDPRKKDDEEK